MKRSKKLSVTVAIPVRNEEENIVNLIHSIKLQELKNFFLEGIYVYSDGSTDDTVSLVKRSFKDIVVFDFKKNRGKTAMLNKIVSENNTDVTILIDADTKLKNRKVFQELINVFSGNDRVGIVCAYHNFLINDSFIGKLAHFGFRVWDKARKSLGRRGIRYYCEGGLIAFSKQLADQIKYPESYHVGDDTYAFYFAVKNNFKVLLAENAVVNYDLPTRYKDYVRQMKRFLTDPGMVNNIFDKYLVTKYEVMTARILVNAFLSELLKKPFLGISYLILQLTTRLQMLFFKPQVGWSHIERK